MTGDAHLELAATVRHEFGRVVATLVGLTHDLDLAEELAQDAVFAAVEQWPTDGVPDNPGAWLTATAKRRAVDRFRRNQRLREKYVELARTWPSEGGVAVDDLSDVDAALSGEIADDRLRLIFTACHPVLPRPARVALTLRLLGGLTTDEIARAVLASPPAVAQRIVRAKKALAQAGVPFEVPAGPDLAPRLGAVMEVIYLIFNEGYTATAGDDWLRPELCAEALRLGRLLAAQLPRVGEVHGLLALMELQASRLDARLALDGSPVLLLDQDRSRWDGELIDRGLLSLARAETSGERGPYTLQAVIAGYHGRARIAADTDWAAIVSAYDELLARTPSPVVELNRAVAVSMAQGPAAALPLVDALADSPVLAAYHLLPTVRGDLLAKLGRFPQARAEFERAAALTGNRREQELLLARAADCG